MKSITIEKTIKITITPDMIDDGVRDAVWAWLETVVGVSETVDAETAQSVMNIEEALPAFDEVIEEYVDENKADVGENIVEQWNVKIEKWATEIMNGTHIERFCDCCFCKTIGVPLIIAENAVELWNTIRTAHSDSNNIEIEAHRIRRLRVLIKRSKALLEQQYYNLPCRIVTLIETHIDSITDQLGRHEIDGEASEPE
jgi:hypothetical protein